MQLPLFERQAEAFLVALGGERYAHLAGLKPTLDLAAIYDRHRDLFSLQAYEQLRDQPLEPTYLRALLGFVATHFLENGVKALGERLANAEAAGAITWNGVRLPYRTLVIGQGNEPDRDSRHELNELIRAEMARTNRLRVERQRVLRGLVDDLGYSDYAAVWDDLGGLTLGDLSRLAESLLEETSDLYRQALRDQLVHHRLDDGDTWDVDLAWVFRGAEYDRFFPRDALRPALRATLAALGIRLEDQANVRLDLQARPLKSPNAFCAPIEVPDQVVVVQAPIGGRLDFSTLLRQVGEAEHWAHVDRTQPFPYRRCGDRSVGEGYGVLLRQLMLDPAWLRWRLEQDDVRDVLRLAAFEELYALRRSAAMLQHEQDLQGAEEPESVAERYRDRLEEALGVRVFPEEYLAGVGDQMASARHLRGWMLAGQLRHFLKAEYDDEWFRSARAGRFLVDRWREGGKYGADELVRFMGFDGLDARPTLDELRAILSA